jgi:cell shape-determining protein MreD
MALLDIQSANYDIKHLVGVVYAILFGIISRANYISVAGLYRVFTFRSNPEDRRQLFDFTPN